MLDDTESTRPVMCFGILRGLIMFLVVLQELLTMIWSIYILLFANNVLGLFQIYKLGFTPTVIRIILNFRVWLIPSPCSCTIHPCCWCESPFICDLHFASCRSCRNELPCIWIHANSNNPWDPILRIASFFYIFPGLFTIGWSIGRQTAVVAQGVQLRGELFHMSD